MGVLDQWRRRRSDSRGPGAAKIREAVEHIVETANPRLRFVRRYEQRLASSVASAMVYAEEVAMSAPAVHEATTAGWAEDPAVRASFATPGDIGRAFSRSTEVRSFFDRNPAAEAVFAVVGMRMSIRQGMGMALEGSVIQRDVLQTKVSFDDYRVRIIGVSEAALRAEIRRRIVDQLVLDGVGRAAAEQTERESVEQERLLLKTRLRYLEQQGQGMRAALGGEEETNQAALARARVALEENTRALETLPTAADRLDEELQAIIEALSDARQRFYLTTTRLHLDRMNVVQAVDAPQGGDEVEFHLARISADPPDTLAFLLLRFPRGEMLPAETLRSEALHQLL